MTNLGEMKQFVACSNVSNESTDPSKNQGGVRGITKTLHACLQLFYSHFHSHFVDQLVVPLFDSKADLCTSSIVDVREKTVICNCNCNPKIKLGKKYY